jgi:hypothetical protein
VERLSPRKKDYLCALKQVKVLEEPFNLATLQASFIFATNHIPTNTTATAPTSHDNHIWDALAVLGVMGGSFVARCSSLDVVLDELELPIALDAGLVLEIEDSLLVMGGGVAPGLNGIISGNETDEYEKENPVGGGGMDGVGISLQLYVS